MSAIIFVHGAGADRTVWRYQTRRFERLGFNVSALDLPGHGRNRQGGLSDVAGYAAWLEQSIAGDGPVTLVGHSMGGLVGLQVAATAPDLVTRLVLVGTAPRMAVHDDLVVAASSDLSHASELIAGWSLPGSFRGGHPEPGTWQRGANRRLVAASQPGVLAGDLAACVSFDGRPILERIKKPALVIVGSEDRMVHPAGARSVAEGIDGAELVVMIGCGHEPMIQQPREFNSILERWIGSGATGGNR